MELWPVAVVEASELVERLKEAAGSDVGLSGVKLLQLSGIPVGVAMKQLSGDGRHNRRFLLVSSSLGRGGDGGDSTFSFWNFRLLLLLLFGNGRCGTLG